MLGVNHIVDADIIIWLYAQPYNILEHMLNIFSSEALAFDFWLQCPIYSKKMFKN